MLLLATAIAIRAYLVYSADVITPDGMLYIHIAKLIKNSDWKGVYEKGFYSLYPFAIVGFQKIFTEWEMAGRMASVFFGSFTVLPLFFLFRKMFDLKIAVVVCIFFILSPRIAQYSSDVLREPLFWLLSVTALWAGWKGIAEKKPSYAILSSLFTGLACFTRMEGVGTLLIICLWSGWFFLFREHNVKRLVRFLIVFFVSFPLIFTIPLYSLKLRTGKWEMGHVVSKVSMLITRDSRPVEGENRELSGVTGSGPGLVGRYTFSIRETLSTFFTSLHVVFIVLLLFGIFRRRTIMYSGEEIPVLIWVSVFLIIGFLYAFKESYMSTRHGLLMGIPALLWVSIGFFELRGRLETFFKNRHWYKDGRQITVYLLVIICLAVLPKTLLSSDRDKIEMKKAGIYLKNAGYSREKFIVQPRINRLVFYAGSPYIEIPPGSGDYRALSEFLKKQDAAYLIVDERSIDESVTGFREHSGSLDLEKVDVSEFERYKEYSFILYRIRK